MSAAILQQRNEIDQQSVSSLEQSSLQQSSNKRLLKTAE
jgi:hypothetical protein